MANSTKKRTFEESVLSIYYENEVRPTTKGNNMRLSKEEAQDLISGKTIIRNICKSSWGFSEE